MCFSPEILGFNIGNFRDCFQTVWAEFSGLFSDSSDRIFGQSMTDFRTLCVCVFFFVIAKKKKRITCWLCENHVNACLWMY